MAYTIDVAQELRRAFSARLTNSLVGLITGKPPLSCGMKVRVAAALKKIAGALEKQARIEANVTARRRSIVIDGVRFTLQPESHAWVIDAAVAAKLLPIKDYPHAWRKSKSGGNVKIEVGSAPEE